MGRGPRRPLPRSRVIPFLFAEKASDFPRNHTIFGNKIFTPFRKRDYERYVYLEDFEIQLSGAKNADALAGPEETGGRNQAGSAALPDAMNMSASGFEQDTLFAGLNSIQDASLSAADFLSLDSIGESLRADSVGGLLADL